ncbi:MAG: MFS transporter [Gammaproteobacteria bacterium]|nr:MAG: MFS transporter [Gammaproteobacteria bacterium]
MPGPAASLYLARALRDFGDGFVAVLLVIYLAELGLDAFQIGIVATAALLGSALLTLGAGLVGHRFGPRPLLVLASALMVATGLALAAAQSYAVLLLIACIGTINPTAGSVSIFVPLEHAVLADLASDRQRTRMFATYSLTGALAAACGALAAGSPDLLVTLGWTRLAALQAMFVLYAVLGVAGGLLYLGIPMGTAAAASHTPPAPLGPSRRIVWRLAALFSVDAFAGGFAVQALVALWLFQRFDLSLAAAAVFFFWAGLLTAGSYPVAAWLAGRIGLINTMVFTHIPASLCLILAALAPTLEFALALLLMRAALTQMDVPARSSYVMAVVTPPERAAAASITSVPRSLAAALSPALAGAMFAAGHLAWPFVICGVLKIGYDLALLWSFRQLKPPEERVTTSF